MIYYITDYLAHHGVKGMKWGVRRYQKADGTYTSEGMKRYGLDYKKYDSKKQQRIAKKFGKKVLKADEATSRILNARKKNRAKIETRYNSKIAKAKLKNQTPRNATKVKVLQAKKQGVLKDFDDGTRYVSAGQQKYSDIINNYKNAKIKAFEDIAYKNSDEYKRATIQYTNQMVSDMYYGYKGATQFNYTHEEAVKDYKKRGLA